MHRDKLLELHGRIVVIKGYFSARDHIDSSLFNPYDGLAAEPSHVHESKSEHKHAVFMLSSALATTMGDDEFSSAGHIGKCMEGLADDTKDKI